MRILVLAAAAALVLSAQFVATAKAEDTVIRKDEPGRTTIIKKHDEDGAVIRAPVESEKKVIIHHDE